MEENARVDYREYLESVVYFPIEYDVDYPVYCFEYIQRTSSHKKVHYHNGFEIGVCLDGEGIFLVKNKVYAFSKGCVTFISSSQPHIAQSPNDYPSRWLYLTVDWDRLFSAKEPEVVQNVIRDDGMARLVELIYNEAQRRGESSVAIVTHLLNALILEFLRSENEGELGEPPSAKVIDPKIYASIKYIINHYREPLTVGDLAAESNYSLNYFRRLFTEQTGETPLNYITNIRLRMAAILLRSSERTVADVAESCGFSTLSTFNRCFRSKYGSSPAKWRKQW